MISVNEILDFLSAQYPLETACDFDNVGLLVGDGNAKVTKALVCLDCDLGAVRYAADLGIQLIITHHPVIFDGIKNVLCGSVVYELIKNGISVISMHTNLDIADNGVTVALCQCLGFENIAKYIAYDGFTLRSAVCNFKNADKLAIHLKATLGGAVRYVDADKPINRVLVCSGSGGDFLTDAARGGFDALITADVKHHLFVAAKDLGVSLFDAGHYHTENVIITPLKAVLDQKFKGIDFITYSPEYIKTV